MRLFLTLLICVIGFALAGCSDEDKHTDLKKYVKNVKSRTAYAIDSIPKPVKFRSYHYPSDQPRNPFVPVVEKASNDSNAPDQNRPKEPLEAFPLDALRMVGVIRQDGSVWAVVSAPDGGVYKVKEGSYLGQNYGKVAKISDKQLDVEELVPSDNTWVKRSAVMSLVEGE